MWPYMLRCALSADVIRLLGSRPGSTAETAKRARLTHGVPVENWLWRFCRKVRHFATLRNNRAQLHYARELSDGHDPADLMRCCLAELDFLEVRLAAPLPRSVTVYMFARHEEIQEIFGPEYGGTALALNNGVVVAYHEHVLESLRHELAHLYALRWNPSAPPLLREGLAVWLQETEAGLPIDTVARQYLQWTDPVIPSLLNREFFFSQRYRYGCYALSGSFTGFLIRRYGWSSYRSLYVACCEQNVGVQFERCLGISLDHAEWQWRNYVLLMDIFNRRLGRSARLGSS